MKIENRQFALSLLLTFLLALFWSGFRPYSYFTWVLEVLPALIALPILIFTYRRFPLTKLLYTAIFFHALILLIGGHYTYAREPLFNWIRNHFHLARNDFDRLGHFAQGFVPALIAREVFIRKKVVKRGAWMFAIVLCVCMAISATYELFEWQVAVATGSRADDFLGTQGDPWDTQEDMATCMVGALCSLLLLSGYHDHQIKAMNAGEPKPDKLEVQVREPEKPALRVRHALSDDDIRTVRQLFVEYSQSLGFSLSFQNFDQEYLTLPGKYAPPRGCLLLAEANGQGAGCVALRPREEGVCEMKRLYVRNDFRGLGLGRMLVEAVIAEAKSLGYYAMRLDTVEDKMPAAVALYRALGFHDIEPYTANPMESARFMELELAPQNQLNLYGE